MLHIHSQSQQEWLDQLREFTNSKFALISDTTYGFWLEFTPNSWKTEGAEFTNCTFNSVLSFDHVSLKCGIRFENCIFEQGIYMDHCTAGHTNLDFNHNGSLSVEFINCTLKSTFKIGESKLLFGLRASAGSVFQNINLSNSSLGKVQLYGITLDGVFQNTNCDVESCFVEDSLIKEQVSFFNCKTELHFERSTFGIGHFSGGVLKKLVIEKCVFTNETWLYACQITLLGLYDSTFEKVVRLDAYDDENDKEGYIREFKVSLCHFKGELIFTGLSKSAADIGDLVLHYAENLGGNINFTHCKIDSLFLVGNNSSNLTFSFAHIPKINFTEWVNRGMLNFISVKGSADGVSKFSVVKSFLGKAIFSDVDFRSYSEILINHSNVYEILSNSVIWFRDTQLCFEEDCSEFVAAKIKKDLYRQLKFAMEKQGDHFNRLYFKKEEQASYLRELKLTPFRQRNIGDQLIMFFGWINDYGFNWLRPALFIGLWVSTCFCILAYYARPEGVEFTYLTGNANAFFNMFNPIHRISDLFEVNAAYQRSGWFYFWDFAERVFLSLLIFQMVTAFRKYSN